MPDLLVRLFDGARPHGVVIEDATAVPPWSVRHHEGAALSVVALIRGAAVLEVAGRVPVRPARGEVTLVVGPHACTVTVTRAGTALVAGSYDLPGGLAGYLLGGLPVPLTVSEPTVDDLAGQIGTELVLGDGAGPSVVIDRLLDLMVLAALRGWWDQPGSGTPRWYPAQRDPVVRQALALMHDQPGRSWTVAELAHRTSVSRAWFARRFHELVGEPPMAHLTCWRLCLAEDLLRATDDSLATIARKVGYANAFAFSAAFTRVRGVRPGRYRAGAA